MDEYMQMRASQVDEGTAKIFKAAVGNFDMASTMLFQIAKQGVAMREKDQPCEKEGGESQVVEGLSAELNFWREASLLGFNEVCSRRSVWVVRSPSPRVITQPSQPPGRVKASTNTATTNTKPTNHAGRTNVLPNLREACKFHVRNMSLHM